MEEETNDLKYLLMLVLRESGILLRNSFRADLFVNHSGSIEYVLG
jgi:hypothetical protein